MVVELPILLEPTARGFRASIQSPLYLSADGETADSALSALSGQLDQRLLNGSQLRGLRVTDLDTLKSLASRITGNPIYPKYLEALNEYRQEHNTVPDAD
jgi:hypothetical protein